MPPPFVSGWELAASRVGCSGRVALHLQERELEVVGIDSSQGAIEICRRRGVRDARELTLDELDASVGLFDTIVLLGQGLFRSRSRARRVLAKLASIASPTRRIVAETFDPHALNDECTGATASATSVADACQDSCAYGFGTAPSPRRGSTGSICRSTSSRSCSRGRRGG